MEYIVGIIVSLIVQGVKKLTDDDYVRLLIVLVLSLFAATLYHFLKDTNLWQTLLQILTTAGATYTFLIRRFE